MIIRFCYYFSWLLVHFFVHFEDPLANFDNKNSQEHKPLDTIVHSGVTFVFVSIDILIPQYSVDEVDVLVPPQHEKHHHEQFALLQEGLNTEVAHFRKYSLFRDQCGCSFEQMLEQVPLDNFKDEHEEPCRFVDEHTLLLVVLGVVHRHISVLLA